MKTTVIISGGSLENDFALAFLKEHSYEYLVGADSGIEFLRANGIEPTHIVGDFDSTGKEALSFFEEKQNIEIRRFNPHKDFTDTQLALDLALELGSGRVYILGCFGTRIDHVLANVRILRMALERGAECFLCDARNRVRLTDRSITLQKQGQYGKYVSLFALSGEVTGLTLKGFCYPLTDYTMKSEDSIGVSNEIKDREAQILFKSGKLVIVESRD